MWPLPAAEDHRWKCSFRVAKSLWNISLQLPVCAGTSQQLQKGCPCSSLYLFFFSDCFFLKSVCLGSSFCVPFSVLSWVLPALRGELGRAGWREQCGCWLSAAYCHKYFLKRSLSSAFWVCFPWAFFHY